MKLALAFVLAVTMSMTGATKVYVCDSDKAVAYHQSDNCRGLNKCTHPIISITVQSAKDRGLHACQICY